MSTTSGQRIAGWAAVAAQFVAIAGIALSPGDASAFPSWVPLLGGALVALGVVTMIVAFIGLGSALTPTPVPVAGARLWTSGIPRVRRRGFTAPER